MSVLKLSIKGNIVLDKKSFTAYQTTVAYKFDFTYI